MNSNGIGVHIYVEDHGHYANHRISVFGTREQCKSTLDLLRSLVPKSDGRIDNFTAPNDENWDEKYRQHLYNTQPD